MAQRLFRDFSAQMKDSVSEGTFDSPNLHDSLLVFINKVAKMVASLYQKMASEIKETMEGLVKIVKKSRMMNNFLLFKVFRELSVKIRLQTIETCTDSIFRYCPQETIE